MKIKIGDLFESNCTTLVNTINCVGVMGKGIALEFKKRFPEMYNDYVAKCKLGKVNVGIPYLFVTEDKNILNFPTKLHWRSPSQLSYIIDGLDWFVENYEILGIKSIAFAPLGCGNGGLSWEIVGPLMYQKLKDLPIDIEIYAPYGTPSYQLEKDYLCQNTFEKQAFKMFDNQLNSKWYLILQSIRELNEKKYSLKVGRTIYQKLCYVLTRNGIETGFIFTKQAYGPFSIEAKNSITILANANMIKELQLGEMFNITVPESVKINKNDFADKEWKAMKEAVDLFSRIKNTSQAEMIATVLFAYDQLKLSKKTVSDSNIYEYVLNWKPHWGEKNFELKDSIQNLAMLNQMTIYHEETFEY